MGREFANGRGDQRSTLGLDYQKLKKLKLMNPCLRLSIIRKGSKVSVVIQREEWHIPVQLL